ncbi:TIGR02266 family protein [Myxococcota bacterium]|nr:TIGR02266 family protein [Myxococcota bacterium]MBU1430376.1 TIGR02266 family protein [Myxococcota bacterium]MBU1899223.1 TIGR02266 family protein [Myxococcota bacterium]
MFEKRRHDRAPAIIKVNYESAGSLKSDYAINISKGGLFIATDQPFELGQALELHLSSVGVRRSIPVPAEVRWVGEQDGEQGIGIRFLLEDPITRARVETMVNAVFDPLPPAAMGERVNLLLVDPNRHACRLFREGIGSMAKRIFEVDDYFVIIECNEGLSALNHLRISKFSMVVLELQMPEVEGVELIRKIRTEISQTLPVVAMSKPTPGARYEAMASGADMFLPKPIQLRALFNTVCMMLKLQLNDREGAA